MDTTDDSSTRKGITGSGLAVPTAVGSILLALYYYYIKGDKHRGLFVGLWPATILGLATYRQLKKLSQQLNTG